MHILFITCINTFLLYINKNALNNKYKFKKEEILILLNNYFIKSLIKGMVVVESYK